MHDIYDTDCDAASAHFQILPMPFDATTSYRPGTAQGPEAILAASVQVDLRDSDVGSPYKAGIHLVDFPSGVAERNRDARACVKQDPPDVDKVNRLTALNNIFVYDWTKNILIKNQTPIILGGDHSVPFGAIQACAEQYKDLGILHIDAHADLRHAYQGFHDSHASIMNNVIRRVPEVTKLIQIGVRDFCEEEALLIENSNDRIKTYFDSDVRRARMKNLFLGLCEELVDHLPQHVYLSIDIDGLDPTLCPNTGTPVPGGLRFDEFITLLEVLAQSGKKIIGMDLVEVAGDCWDANVGARVLYKMIGFANMTHTDKEKI